MTPARAALSDVESARFGVRVARSSAFSAREVPDLVRWCRANEVGVLMARCPASDTAAVHAMEEAGGRLMDTLVYWERDLERRPFRPDPAERPVRPATRADESRLAEIARTSFTGYYGHYHADPRLDPAAATEGYAEWATRLLGSSDRASTVLLADGSGRPAGFGVFVAKGTACDYVLAGVEPAAQGGGLYRAILSGGLAWATAGGFRTFFSSTPITNLGVQKVWARLGMELKTAEYTFHLWL